MSDKLQKSAHGASALEEHGASAPEEQADVLVEQLDDLLGDIEEVLSVRPPPLTGWSAIPPAKPSIDDLAELAEQLRRDREVESERDLLDAFAAEPSVAPSISVAIHDDEFADEPTQDWGPMAMRPSVGPSQGDSRTLEPVPPPAKSAAFLSEPDYLTPRDEMPSLVDTFDEACGTLRPSAVSLLPAHPAPSRWSRVPWGHALGAALAVAAAIVAYRVGPYGGDPADAHHVTVARQPLEVPLAARAAEPEAASAASVDEQRLLVTVSPANAYLSIRPIEAREAKRSAGPWPKAFDLTPGDYELVAFRAGFKPLVRRITVRPGVRPGALDLRLAVDDIYD